jgi:uncharacterized protein (TIGR02466 family)
MNLFSTSIHQFRLSDYQQLAEIIKDDAEYSKSASSFSIKGPTSIHTRDDLAHRDEPWSKNLRNILYSATREYFVEQNIGIPFADAIIFRTWAVVLRSGGYSAVHTHPGCRCSGVLWLDMPDNMPEGQGDFVMIDPRPAMRQSGQELFRIRPEPGHGLVFPNWLEHYVDAHYCDGDRVSISWNAIF